MDQGVSVVEGPGMLDLVVEKLLGNLELDGVWVGAATMEITVGCQCPFHSG